MKLFKLLFLLSLFGYMSCGAAALSRGCMAASKAGSASKGVKAITYTDDLLTAGKVLSAEQLGTVIPKVQNLSASQSTRTALSNADHLMNFDFSFESSNEKTLGWAINSMEEQTKLKHMEKIAFIIDHTIAEEELQTFETLEAAEPFIKKTVTQLVKEHTQLAFDESTGIATTTANVYGSSTATFNLYEIVKVALKEGSYGFKDDPKK